MDGTYSRGSRGRGGPNREASPRGRPHSRNKHWTNDSAKGYGSDGERWERGGHRGGGRGRGGRGATRIYPNVSLRINHAAPKVEPLEEEQVVPETEEVVPHEYEERHDDDDSDSDTFPLIVEPELNDPSERDAFWQKLVKAREVERKQAIAEGKMDDPTVAKRLEDAITIVGTCRDMCPRFERYRREKENNLFEWEIIPGTKRVDHNRAVKMYERAAGDKVLPSDLRPPRVLKRTLNYLFRNLMENEGFQATYNFVRDRSRAVRNDFTMQHINDAIAIECHDRCARFHILGMHLNRDVAGFDLTMEDRQLMNTLQSLKEFYDENRGTYQSPTELEMRVYHRLIHIRDQVERPERMPVPAYITEHPIFKLVTQFRLHVQEKSTPIKRDSKLVVGEEGMQIFADLARQLNAQGSAVMVYLVACIVERLFGKDTIEDIESLRGNLKNWEIIDGVTSHGRERQAKVEEITADEEEDVGGEVEYDEQEYDDEDQQHYEDEQEPEVAAPVPAPAASPWPTTGFFSSQPSGTSAPSMPSVAQSAFGNLKTTTTNVFGGAVFGAPPSSSSQPAPQSVFSTLASQGNASASVFGAKPIGQGAVANGSAPPNGSTAQTTSIFGKPFSLPPAQPSAASSNTPSKANGDAQAPSLFGKPFSLANAPPLSGGDEPRPASPPKPAPSPFSNTTTSQPNLFNQHPDVSSTPQGKPISSFPTNGFPSTSTSSTNLFPSSSSSSFSFNSTTSNGSPAAKPSLNPQAPAFTPSESATSSDFFSQPPPIPSGAFKLPSFSTTTSASPSAAPAPPPTQPAPVVAPIPQPSFTNGVIPAFASSSNSLFARGVTEETPAPSLIRKSSSGSKSTTPPTTRLVAPPLLKIDANTSTGSTSTASSSLFGPPPAAAAVGNVDSPREPPPLARKVPVALPETPTLPPNPLLGHLKHTLAGSPSGSFMNQSQEILSPLIMGSPTTGSLQNLKNFSPLATPSVPRRFSVRHPSPSEGSLPVTNGKGKERQTNYTEEEEQEMMQRAMRFEQGTTLVKRCFQRWVEKTTDRLVYLEALRKGDEYRERLQLQQSAGSSSRGHSRSLSRSLRTSGMNGRISVKENALASLDKKRRMSRNGAENEGDGALQGLSPLKKRPRKSAYVAPRTDDELARRLKENHEEQEKRWAQGSFLQVIRSHVKSLSSSVLKLPWNLWVSMNPESDATAIWLERKFDIPASGTWVDETIFSIPLSSATIPSESGHPGLIVFECTPLGDLTDDLEKKYRILDDCARLREVIKALSPRRYFVPSLLIICWCEPEELSKESDFFDMVKKLTAESTLGSYHVLPMTATTTDLDNKLDACLKSMSIDAEGKLIHTLSLRDVFKLFEPTYTSFVNEWIENSTIHGTYHWSLYGQSIQASIDLLNTMVRLARSLLEVSAPPDEYPPFDPAHVDDSESCYDEVNDWLSTLSSRDDARLVATDLHSHRNIGQPFPTRIFMDHLFEITEIRFERLFPKLADTHHPILITNINTAVQTFKDALRPHQMKLSQTYNFSVRRSPRRRPYSATTSEVGSPSVKRARLSASVTPFDIDQEDDRISDVVTPPAARETASPAPSNISAATTTEPPSVTVAMLRALTKDVKKKYGRGS